MLTVQAWLKRHPHGNDALIFDGRRANCQHSPRREMNHALGQFQLTSYEKGDVKKMVAMLNKGLGSQALSSDALNDAFDVWWPKLQEQLDPLNTAALKEEDAPQQPVSVTPEGMLEEILELAREQRRLLKSPEMGMSRGYFSGQGNYVMQGHALRYIQGRLKDISMVLHADSKPGELPSLVEEEIRAINRYIDDVNVPPPIDVPEGNVYTSFSPIDGQWIQWTAHRDARIRFNVADPKVIRETARTSETISVERTCDKCNSTLTLRGDGLWLCPQCQPA